MRNYMRGIFILLLSTSYSSMMAQNNQAKDFYAKFKEQAIGEYTDFRARANQIYAEFVRQAWTYYQVLPAIPNPMDETVPPQIAPDEDKDKEIEDKSVPFDVVSPVIEQEKQPIPPAPIREQPVEEDGGIDLLFYGLQCHIRLFDTNHFKLRSLDENDIADSWNHLSKNEFDNAIRDCLELRIRYNLNDWAYLQMLRSIAYQFCGDGSNEATLLTAYLFCQSGYQVRLAKDTYKLYVLFASKHKIYDCGYFQIDGVNYYPLDFKGNELLLCQASFPKEQPLSLFIGKSPLFAWAESKEKNVKSERYSNMSFSWRCNQNMIDFYNNYPSSMVGDNFMTRWAIYANTPMEEKLKEQLYPQIRKVIDGMSQKEAVKRILNWIQTGFEYEYDDKVWGGDRAFFPEETLFYPYCDCEDRSILLTRLVRDLLELKCILVFYPGHLACAVAFEEPVRGDYIQLGDVKYTICDPTYIGAPVGVTMPEMDNSKANVILLQ